MIKNEIYKIWSKRSFWLFLTVLIAINLGIHIYENSKDEIPFDAYRQFDKYVEDMLESEKFEYISEEYTKIQSIDMINMIKAMEASDNEMSSGYASYLLEENKDNYNKYYSQWKENNYLEYTDQLYLEVKFWDDIYEKWNISGDYDKVLNSIVEQGKVQSQISIFSGSDENGETFSSRNIKDVVSTYEKLSGTETTFYSYEWVTGVVSGYATDLLVFLFIFIIAGTLIYEEKKKNLIGLIRSTPGGRARCIAAKLVALSISITAITFIFYCCNLLYYAGLTGLHGWNEAVQSVSDFTNCPYRISAAAYVLLCVLLKAFSFIALAVILILVAIFEGNFMWVFISGTGIMGGSIILFNGISSIEKYNWLHYCNFWNFLKTEKLLGNYVNLNFLERPVSVFRISSIICIALFLIFSVLCLAIYTTKRNYSVKKLVLPVKLPVLKIGRACNTITGNETFKILITNGGLLIFAIFAGVMAYQTKNTSIYLTPNQFSYQNQMKALSGELTEEKAEKLEEKRKTYEEIQSKLDEVEAMRADGEINDDVADNLKLKYENEMAFYPAFQRVYNRYLYIKDNSDAEFVYEDGYYMLFGLSGNGNAQSFILISICLVLVCIPVFCYDKERGLISLLRTTSGGRRKSTFSKLTIIMVYTLLLLVVYAVRQFMTAETSFGLDNFSASIKSIPGFENYPSWMSIRFTFTMFTLIKYLLYLVIAAVILTISYKGRTIILGMLTSAAILVLPILLYELGLEYMKYFSIYTIFLLY